jgi:Flp pilus assembly protein TadD
MKLQPWVFVAIVALGVACVSPGAEAGDVRINVPRRTQLTPVQRLNREGVEAIRKHKYDEAKTLFYRAYLFDPNDPFTLNNLAYVAELEGQVQRAQTFYDLATQQATDAVIDKASKDKLEGQSFRTAINGIHDASVQIDRANVNAVRLLSEGRAPDADLLLQKTLALDPNNPFTLNNIGVTKEMEGDFPQALKAYTAAADLHSQEPIVVTLDGKWRGQPISQAAASSMQKVRQRMRASESPQIQAELLNLRGVMAINRNDGLEASQDFLQAYKLNPYSAFSLNNLGYVSELDGDVETAQFFYEKARSAPGANARIGIATRQSADGKELFTIAGDSGQKIDAKITATQEAKRQQQGPIELKRRDNSHPAVETPAPAPR